MNNPIAFHLNRFSQLCAYVLLFASCIPCGISQGALVYTFSGQVPTHTSPLGRPLEDTHPFIEPGETWIATFVIDENARPSYSRRPIAIYDQAVKSGSLKFSGGYVAPFNFARLDVTVMDDGEGIYDGVAVSFGFRIQAITNSNPLNSIGLPGPGTRFLPNPSYVSNWPQLQYSDSYGGIVYFADLSNNIRFSASIPEPTSLTLASLLGGSLVLARRCRR